ncbi:MAG: DUF1499 domain-containing protein [Deinococcus sp.]|nr:DUF1499 domain-containing protein [Deinococcus sp.]
MWWIVAVVVAVLGIVLFAGPEGLVKNVAQTSPNAKNPALRTRVYARDYATVFQAAQEAVSALRIWELVSADQADGQITALVHIPVFGFIDDVTITLEQGSAGVRVNVRSASRVGKGDLGMNARHIRAYLQALDRRLGQS